MDERDQFIKAFQRSFGLYLFLRRQKLGLTQKEVSERAGVRRTDISSFEVGRNTNPSIVTLLKLLYALGLNIDLIPREPVTDDFDWYKDEYREDPEFERWGEDEN